jgi:transposase
VAILKTIRPVHLEIQTHRANPVGILRSSFRKDGKVMHSNHGRITGLSLDQLKLIQAAFAGDVLPKGHADALRILQSKEYGASRSALHLARDLELDRALYSRPEPWVKDALAMVAGRLIYQGSKLSLSHQWPNTTLWEQCGVQGPVDVQKHCYEPMDRLLDRQDGIQKALARKHLQDGRLVLYDITSSFFEGEYEESDIVTFGYNRDGKRHHEQMVIGLICNEDGCPVAVEVFPGNTQDASTVPDKIKEVQQKYKIKKLIFVGDRGMVTQANYEKVKDWEGLWTIGALTHKQIIALLERKVITPELFDECSVVEVIDPENLKLRYCLCRNPETRAREQTTRKRLLELTQAGLEKIAKSKRKSDAAKIGARVGQLLAKYKMGKFILWEVKETKLTWSVDEKAVEAEAIWDGCYVVRTDVPKEELAAAQTVAGYKKLGLVEQAFGQLKTVQLEIRPVYHKLDRRIRSHVFLCMLAYYLEWHMKQRLAPLFAQDGHEKNRRWSFANVIERLKAIRQERVKLNGVEFNQLTSPDDDQQRILDLLKTKL